MKRTWRKRLIILAVVLAVLMAGYSYFFRHYLDADQYLAMALDAAGNDPAIINADEPDFKVGFHNGRLMIHFVFQTEQEAGIGSISLYIDPFRKTYVDVEKLDYYSGLE
jgi:hypothetical protein